MSEAPIPEAPGVSTGTLERISLYATRNERNLSIAFFAAGFLFDILTLGRIDSWLTIGQQAAYLIAVTLVLMQMLVEENAASGQPERSAADLAALPRMKRWYYEYRSPSIHFLLGALLSAYTLFFFKSSSLLVSFGFLLVLAALLVANEAPRFKALGLRFKFALLALCWLAFFAYVIRCSSDRPASPCSSPRWLQAACRWLRLRCGFQKTRNDKSWCRWGAWSSAS